jgi:hypothetical protein
MKSIKRNVACSIVFLNDVKMKLWGSCTPASNCIPETVLIHAWLYTVIQTILYILAHFKRNESIIQNNVFYEFHLHEWTSVQQRKNPIIRNEKH